MPPLTRSADELLNHTIMVNKMTFFEPAVQAFLHNYPLVRINLAEAASSYNGASNDYGLEQTFGAALWQVDWMMWCMHLVRTTSSSLTLRTQGQLTQSGHPPHKLATDWRRSI